MLPVSPCRGLFVHHDLHENPSRYSELTNNEDGTWSTFIVNDDMDVVAIILWMADKPCSRRNPTAAVSRRRLLTRRSVGKPYSTLAGRWIVPLGNVQSRVAALMKVGVAVAVPVIPLSRSRVSREASGYKANQDNRL